jgi:hypothetical protein
MTLGMTLAAGRFASFHCENLQERSTSLWFSRPPPSTTRPSLRVGLLPAMKGEATVDGCGRARESGRSVMGVAVLGGDVVRIQVAPFPVWAFFGCRRVEAVGGKTLRFVSLRVLVVASVL